MNPIVQQMLALQGEIKVALMLVGRPMPEDQAHDLAGQIFDLFATSPLMALEARAAYEALGKEV